MNTLVVIFVPAAGSPEEVEAALLLRLRPAGSRCDPDITPCRHEPKADRSADSLVREPGDSQLRGQGCPRSQQWFTESADAAPSVAVPTSETRVPEELPLWTWFIRNPDH